MSKKLKIKCKDSFMNGAGVALQDLMAFTEPGYEEVWQTIDPFNALSESFRRNIIARIVALLAANMEMIEEDPQEHGIEFEGK